MRWRHVALAAAAVALVIVAFAAAARDTIERMMIERSLAASFGSDASIAALRHAGGLTIVEGLRVQTAGGSATVTADRIEYTVSGDTWDMRPSGLHVTLALDHLRGDELDGVQIAAHALNLRHLVLHLTNASVSLTRGTDAATAKVELAGIGGTLDAFDRVTYDLRGNLIAATGSYPFVASAVAAAGGTIEQDASAAALPLAPLAALLGNAGLTVRTGEARNVAFSTLGGLHGTFTLAGVGTSIGGVDVNGLAGPVIVVPNGIGSPALDATLADGTPVAAAGEVHDGLDWGRIVTSGTRDLRALARMFALLAAQPNRRWINLETTAPGVTFGQYAMTTKSVPHVIQLIEVDPREPTLRFDTALAGDHIISSGARTSDLGIRTQAVAGANGDYFDIGRTYEPQGLLIRSGVLLHGPTDHEALVIDSANKATFAIFHLRGSVVDGAHRYPITLFNSWPTRDVAIVTPDYGKLLPAAPGVTFAALTPLGGTRYRVRSVQPMTTALPVTFGVGFGELVHEALPKPGDVVDVRYTLDPPVPGAVAGIGSGPLLLKDGAWFEDRHAPAPDERDVQWPVIAIGTMPSGTLMFVAVDGRHPERSIGMTRPEFGTLLRSYGMLDAMALDSGGSVTLVLRAPGNSAVTVRNVPSDFSEERYVTDALFVYSSAPPGTIVTAPRPHVEPSPPAGRAP